MPTQETALSSPKDYDVDQWSTLLKCDDDLAKVAEKIRLLGENCVDELACSYLLLNDKKCLPDIVQQIIAGSRGELPSTAARVTKEGLHEGRKMVHSGMESAREEEFQSLVRALTPHKQAQKETLVSKLINNSFTDVLILVLMIFLAGYFFVAFAFGLR
jgi:DNA-binding FrmR family transcriptional regulator